MNSRLFVSVVVCTLNGANHLAETIESLLKQTYPKNMFEIIIVDDGSTDETAEIIKRFGVRVISHATNLGLGVARNTGLKAAKGDIIAFTDDDCIPDNDWLRRLVSPYSDLLVMATGGKTFAVSRIVPTERYMDLSGYGNPAPFGLSGGNSILARLHAYLTQMYSPLHLSLKDGDALQEVYTLNASYRIQLLRKIDGFDERLRAAEDSDVSARLHDAFPNHRIVYAAKAKVGHRHRDQLRPWIKQTYERSQDAYLQIRKEGRIPPIYPFPLCAIVFGLSAFISGTWIGIAVSALAPIVFYSWWQVRVDASNRFDRLRLPYIQFALELATLLGYLVAFLRLNTIFNPYREL